MVSKSHLVLPLKDYQQELRNKRVKDWVLAYLRRVRTRIYERKMARLLRHSLRLKTTLFQQDHSFYDVSGIRDHHRLFYNRTQQHLLDCFL